MKNEFDEMVVKTSRSLFHSIEDHNYWIKRNKTCPYCLNGSKPRHRSEIEVLIP